MAKRSEARLTLTAKQYTLYDELGVGMPPPLAATGTFPADAVAEYLSQTYPAGQGRPPRPLLFSVYTPTGEVTRIVAAWDRRWSICEIPEQPAIPVEHRPTTTVLTTSLQPTD